MSNMISPLYPRHCSGHYIYLWTKMHRNTKKNTAQSFFKDPELIYNPDEPPPAST